MGVEPTSQWPTGPWSYLNVRIDHAPDSPPTRQVPLTMACIAFSKRSASGASGFPSTAAVQVPEYSPARPDISARQAPVHPWGDFAADHAPSARALPCASTSVHVPVTVPVVS